MLKFYKLLYLFLGHLYLCFKSYCLLRMYIHRILIYTAGDLASSDTFMYTIVRVSLFHKYLSPALFIIEPLTKRKKIIVMVNYTSDRALKKSLTLL